MRDLFQVVFELKKKEIEMAKQQLEDKTLTSNILRHINIGVAETKSKVFSNYLNVLTPGHVNYKQQYFINA